MDLHVGRLLVDVRPVGRRRVALEHMQQLVAAVALLKHLGAILQHANSRFGSAEWRKRCRHEL